jgi:hypothetical protein
LDEARGGNNRLIGDDLGVQTHGDAHDFLSEVSE